MEEATLTELCIYCNHEQKEQFRFCSKCGKRNVSAVKAEKENNRQYNTNMAYLAAYTLLSIVLLLIGTFTGDTFESLLVWVVCFAVIDLVFAFLQPTVWTYLRLHTIKVVPLLTIIAICISSGILISYSLDYINTAFFHEETVYMPIFGHLENPLLYAILFTALFPAFFEELAFRGFVFNNIRIIAGKRSAFWSSAFLFALVHLSLLSIIWILPFGLLLSFYRQKYATLLYGVIGHFTHNTTVILIEYYGFF